MLVTRSQLTFTSNLFLKYGFHITKDKRNLVWACVSQRDISGYLTKLLLESACKHNYTNETTSKNIVIFCKSQCIHSNNFLFESRLTSKNDQK